MHECLVISDGEAQCLGIVDAIGLRFGTELTPERASCSN